MELKSYFSRTECFDLRGSISRYAETRLLDVEIEGELQECQQFYKELSMINQFVEQPLDMPPPDFFFSQFTYPLAVRLSQSKHFWKDIKNFCLDNDLLIELIVEIYNFFCTKYSFQNIE